MADLKTSLKLDPNQVQTIADRIRNTVGLTVKEQPLGEAANKTDPAEATTGDAAPASPSSTFSL